MGAGTWNLPSASHSRRASSGLIWSAGLQERQLGREGRQGPSFWVWQSTRSPPPISAELLLCLWKISDTGPLLSREMRHCDRFDIYLVSYQVTLPLLPGLTHSPSLSVWLSQSPQVSYIKLPLKCFELSAPGSYDWTHGGLLFNLTQESEMKMTCRILTWLSDKNDFYPPPLE